MTAHTTFLFASLKFRKTKDATESQHAQKAIVKMKLAIPDSSARDAVQTNALTCTYLHMHTNAHTNAHTHTSTHTHTHKQTRANAHTNTHTHARTHTRKRTRTQTHTHTHASAGEHTTRRAYCQTMVSPHASGYGAGGAAAGVGKRRSTARATSR